MKKLVLLLSTLVFFAIGCSLPDPPDPCAAECAWECSHDKPNDTCLNNCKADCAAEKTSKASLGLSPTLTQRWILDAQNAPSTSANCANPNTNTWCECGTNYTDDSAGCVKPTATQLFVYPPISCPGQVAPGAVWTVNANASTWSNPSTFTVKLHALLKPVVQPPTGQQGACASASVASWYGTGTELWSVPGAKGDGTDRTSFSAPKLGKDQNGNDVIVSDVIPYGDNVVTHRWDVTALLNSCAANAPCVLALYNVNGVHLNSLGGTATLTYQCGGPVAVCGDGEIDAPETCDDGNSDANDGCAGCAVATGYTCSGEPSVCSTSCGDGVMAGSEECDLGAQNGPQSACSALCVSQSCTTTCQ